MTRDELLAVCRHGETAYLRGVMAFILQRL